MLDMGDSSPALGTDSGAEDWRSALDGLRRRADGPSNDQIASFIARLGLSGGLEGFSGPEIIDRIAALERLKAAAAAEQARAQAEFATLCEEGLDSRAARVKERSAAAQIALARKVSPSRGARLLAMSRRLVDEMPHTLDALAAGHVNEERAIVVAEAVEVLRPSDRSAVDRELCGDPRRLEGLGDRGVQDAVRACVDAIDDSAALARVRKAESERRVTIRRLPDSMAKVTAILPVAQAAAVGGALDRAVGQARAAGDERTAGQVAADRLVELVTGQTRADAVPLRVGLVMTDASLFSGGREPARLQGYGTIPADQARAMAAAGADSLAGAWLRRLYLDPSTGELAAMDAKTRRFPRALAEFIEIRDQVCRTPYCDTRIKHIDHVVPFAAGGETSVDNGQGLCERCNYTKDSPGWEQAVVAGETPDVPRADIVTITPTGHEYFSPPPRLPGALPNPSGRRAG